jgi:hypothetical protein
MAKKVPSVASVTEDPSISASMALLHAFSSEPTEHTAPVYVSLLEKNFNERELMGICRHLITWASKAERGKENYAITQFFNKLGMHYSTVLRLRARFKFFDEACLIALEMLGENREWKGLTREWSEKMVYAMMPAYNAMWLKETERMAKLKETSNPEEGIKVVYVPTYIEKEPTKGE